MDQAEIERRVALALEMHHNNYACSQSVACATCDLVGLDSDLMFRLMEGFGFGMGTAEQTCGAVSGAVAVLSYANSTGQELHESKAATLRRMKTLSQQCIAEYGSAFCSALRPASTTKDLDVCDGYIAFMTRVLCNELQ